MYAVAIVKRAITIHRAIEKRGHEPIHKMKYYSEFNEIILVQE